MTAGEVQGYQGRRLGPSARKARSLDAETLSLTGGQLSPGSSMDTAPSLGGGLLSWRSSGRTFVIVGLSAIVPLVLLSLVFGYRASTQQRQTAEFQVSMRADGAAHRLDSILAAQSAAVLGVAGFRSLGLGDYQHFYEHLQVMPHHHPEWQNIILADESGERLMDLRSPFGRHLPPLDFNLLPLSSSTGMVVIGGIAPPGSFAKGRSVPIYVPVLGKDGEHLVVLVALDPSLIATVLDEAGLPADWRGAVLDSDGMVVARTANSPLALGEKARDGRREDPGQTYTLSAKIDQAHWTMLCNIPTALLNKPVNDAWWLMLILGGCALGLAVMLASQVARDIAERRQLDLAGAERKFQASEAWRLLAVDAAAIGTWHWDAQQQQLQACSRCRQLLDLRDEAVSRRDLRSRLVGTEGKAVIRAALASYQAGLSFEREFRVSVPQSGELWLQAYGRPLFDAQGRPIGTYGILINIDDQKRAQDAHRDLLGRLHSAQEEERLRIARDLHDRVGQSITGLSLGLKRLEGTTDKESRRLAFDDLKAMILEISRDVHRAAVELRPTALDDFGLLGAVQTYLREWQSRTGLTVETVFAGLDGSRLPPLIETTAYRIIVELFTNIARHAGAGAVSLTLTRRSDLLSIVVEDDGRGMTATGEAGDESEQRHLGLLGIRERLEIIGGEIHFETAPGEGTAVFVRIHLPQAMLREVAA